MSLEINYEDYLNIFLSNVVFVDQAVPLDLDVIAINIQKMIIDRDGIVTHQDIRTLISDPEPGKALHVNYNIFDTKKSHEKLLLTVIHELSFGVAEVRGFIDGISKSWIMLSSVSLYLFIKKRLPKMLNLNCWASSQPVNQGHTKTFM